MQIAQQMKIMMKMTTAAAAAAMMIGIMSSPGSSKIRELQDRMLRKPLLRPSL